MFLEIWKKT